MINSFKNCSACGCSFNMKVLQVVIYFSNSPDGSCSYCPGIQGYVENYVHAPNPGGGHYTVTCPNCIPSAPVIYPICAGASGAISWLAGQFDGLISNPLIAWNTIATATFLANGTSPTGITYGTAYVLDTTDNTDNSLCGYQTGPGSCWNFNTYGPDPTTNWLAGFTTGPDCTGMYSSQPCSGCGDWGSSGPIPGVPNSSLPAFYAQIAAVQTICPNIITGAGNACYCAASGPSSTGSACPTPPNWTDGDNIAPPPFGPNLFVFGDPCHIGTGGGSSCGGSAGWHEYAIPVPDFNFCNTPPASAVCLMANPVGYFYTMFATNTPVGCTGGLTPCDCNSPDPYYGSDDP